MQSSLKGRSQGYGEMADLPATVSHEAARNKSTCHRMLEIEKKNNKGWLILDIQRLVCGEKECEMLEHVAEGRLPQEDMAEDAVTAWDRGKGIVWTPRDGWERPHFALLILSAFFGSLSLSGCQELSGFGLFLFLFLDVGWEIIFLYVSM